MKRGTRILLFAALLLVGFLTVTFAVRALHHARYLRSRTEEPLQAWMNVPYIANAYRVDPWVIHEALGLPPDKRDRRPLFQIAQDQGRSPDELIEAVTEAIRRSRLPQPPPPPRSPAPPPPPLPATPGARP